MASEITEADAREIKGVVESAENNMRMDDVYLGGKGAGEGMNNIFPARYFARKDDEKKVRLLQEYTASLNSDGRLPTIYAPTENDINVLMRKDAEKELMNFEAFLQNYFDVDNPIHQRLLHDVYPNYFNRRWEVIVDKLEVQKKIAKLKLFGPQTREDVMFMYALHNGDIEIPKSVVFDTTQTDEINQKRFARGYFNIHHWTDAPTGAGRVGTAKFFDVGGLAAGTANIGAFDKIMAEVARKGAGQENAPGGIVSSQWSGVFGERGKPAVLPKAQ